MTWYADDLQPGQRFDFSPYQLTERAVIDFARAWDPIFTRPVRPPTTLSGHATIRTITGRSGRGDAVMVIDGELAEVTGPVVLRLVNESVLPLRNH